MSNIGVIENPTIVEKIREFTGSIGLTDILTYCTDKQCKDNKDGHFSIYGYNLKELTKIVNSSKKITGIDPHQEIISCGAHYEDVLREICKEQGLRRTRFDIEAEDDVTDGIWAPSLVWAPYRKNEPRVFVVGNTTWVMSKGGITVPELENYNFIIDTFIKSYGLDALYTAPKQKTIFEPKKSGQRKLL